MKIGFGSGNCPVRIHWRGDLRTGVIEVNGKYNRGVTEFEKFGGRFTDVERKTVKIARKPACDVRRAERAAEIGGPSVMQRPGTGGGPGPLVLQGPPRSLKISPVNLKDEPNDPLTQSMYHFYFFFFRQMLCLNRPF